MSAASYFRYMPDAETKMPSPTRRIRHVNHLDICRVIGMTMKLFEKGLIWQWASAPTYATPRESRGYANWMLIDEAKGEIVAIGSGDTPAFIRTKAATTVNLGGKLVLPGLQDSHIHVYLIGEVAHYVDLRGTTSFDELRDRVQGARGQAPRH